jgi:hypothetical protein
MQKAVICASGNGDAPLARGHTSMLEKVKPFPKRHAENFADLPRAPNWFQSIFSHLSHSLLV